MKPLYPLDDEVFERIGAATLVFYDNLDIFGQVTFKQFCSLFTDVIEDDDDIHEARIIHEAPVMYKLLADIQDCLSDYELPRNIEARIHALIERIDCAEAQS